MSEFDLPLAVGAGYPYPAPLLNVASGATLPRHGESWADASVWGYWRK
jgi:hypothetical protein